MTNITDLAQQAITHLRPEFLVLAGKAAEGAATESGKQLLAWLQKTLKGRPADAVLQDATAHPDDTRRLDALKLQIEFLLEENATMHQDLADLLKTFPAPTAPHQTAIVTGSNNNTIQTAGHDNKIQIG